MENSNLICRTNQLTGFYMIATLAFNPFQTSVAFHMETSLLISSANQMIGFLVKCNTWLKRVHTQIFIL